MHLPRGPAGPCAAGQAAAAIGERAHPEKPVSIFGTCKEWDFTVPASEESISDIIAAYRSKVRVRIDEAVSITGSVRYKLLFIDERIDETGANYGIYDESSASRRRL